MNEQILAIAICIVALLACLGYVFLMSSPNWLYWLGNVPPPMTEEQLNAEVFTGVRDEL